MASRTRVAAYVAGQLAGKRSEALTEAAAWLLDTGRAHQAKYLARDVAQVLAERGYVYARVTTARPLSDGAWAQITEFIKTETKAKEIELEQVVDAGIVGGVRIEVPGAELDATLQTKLTKLVEGVGR